MTATNWKARFSQARNRQAQDQKLTQDPAFRQIGSEKTWDSGAALTIRVPSFESEMLAEEEHFAGLGRSNCTFSIMREPPPNAGPHGVD